MTTTDTAIRLQVAIERFKASQSRQLIKVVGAVEAACLSSLPAVELRSHKMPIVTKILTMALNKSMVASSAGLSEYQSSLIEFARFQAGLESEIWGAKKAPAPSEITEAMDLPLGIDGRERGKSVPQFLQNWYSDIHATMYGLVRRAAFEKVRNPDIVASIRGTRAAHYKDGASETLRRNAITASNTAVQHVATSVRGIVLERTEAQGILWSALFEKTTCARCKGLDNVPFGLDTGPRSPLHYGCRCTMVPIFPDTKIDPGDSYYSWLKTQDRSFIEEAIGVQRAALLIDGGMSATRFSELQLDKRFEPITLEDFKKLAPSAFKRAGV